MQIVTTNIFTLLLILALAHCSEEDNSTSPSTDRNGRIIVLPYPTPVRVPEPYSYPGPSPPVVVPPRTPESFGSNMPPRAPDPYPMYIPPSLYRPQIPSDFQQIPKWCMTMWEREECGMRCWTLRKICRNMYKQILAEMNKQRDDNKPDNEPSPSVAYPYLKPFYQYYYKKPQPAVVYSKTGVAKTYYAQPSWPSSPYSYPYYNKSPYLSSYGFKYSPVSNDFGLNPQFTYVDGHEKLSVPTTTAKTESAEEESSTTATTVATTTTEGPTSTTEGYSQDENTVAKLKRKKVKPSKSKGTYPVKVTYSYPKDSEVNTLSPLMFEYDQYSNRGYYGDRIYMSAVLPVSDRQHRSKDMDYDSFDDFDEMMIEP